uniref:Uncharacterized protein n=1 Tax=Avena sativa TaxID=4498 RepID=A0ACD5Z1I5_AVESA
MSGSYSSRLRGGGLGATTALAAKVALASAALAAAASLARMAVPLLVSCADAFLWKLYLLVTVHVIIFVIWKLSDNKHFHAQQHKDPWAPTPHHPAPPLQTEQVILSSMKRKVEFTPTADVVRCEEFRVPPPVSRPHLEASVSPVNDGVVSSGSFSGESCVTTESEEDAASSAVAASAYVGVVKSRRNVAPAPSLVRERTVVDPDLSLRPPQSMAVADEHFDGADYDSVGGDDDLDATWNAIMQKTRPATAPSLSSSSPPTSRSSPRPKAREPSVGAAELSKRSEDFINRIHHSFGRQQ